MRISPINLKYNQNIQLKRAKQYTKQNNPSFGNFENEEVKMLTYKTVVHYYDDYSEKAKKDPRSMYSYYMNSIKKNMDFFEHTPFVTIKKWNGSDGKEYPYAALNRTETDKHENKELFNDIIKNAQYHPYGIEKEIIAKDPDFIGIIENDDSFVGIQGELYNADNGIVLESSNNSSYTRPQEDDLWLEAVSREIHS